MSKRRELAGPVALILVKGIGFLAVVAVLAVRVLPAATTLLARLPQLLVLSGMAWAVVLAAGGEALGLSKEVGTVVISCWRFKGSMASPGSGCAR